MVWLVHVMGAKTPSPHRILWGPNLVTAFSQLWDAKKRFSLERGRICPSIQPTTSTPTPCPLSLSLWGNKRHAHVTTLAVHCSRATTWSCYWRGQVPLPPSTPLSFALWGPFSTPAHQRPFLRHAGTLLQFATDCIHHCPFNASFDTQLLSSFVCIVTHLAATEGQSWPWIQSSDLTGSNLCVKGLINHAVEAVVGSRDP